MITAPCARWAAIAALVMAFMGPRHANAQRSPILPSTRIFVAGPLSLYPQIAVRDAGTDSNVYNESTSPRSDLTYSLTPKLYAVLPVGNSRFVGTGTGDIVYYRTYTDQRSLTTMVDGRFEVMSPGLRPFVAALFSSRGDREGFEIDARARRTRTNVVAGAEMDVTALTAVTGWVSRSTTAYGADEQYLNVSLADALNHTSETVAGGVRFRVTPLTTVSLIGEARRDRFTFSMFRDADRWRAGPSVQFDSSAFITGEASVGIQSFDLKDPTLTDYRGLVGLARLHYSVLNITRLDFEADRDVTYSYDAVQPYYLESGGRITVTQPVYGRLEAIAIGERRSVRYPRLGSTSFDGPHEVTTALGGGFAIRLRQQWKFMATYERRARISADPSRQYERHRVLASFLYGL